MKKMLWEQFAVAEKLDALKKMQEKVEYQASSLGDQELSQEASKNLSFYNHQLEKIKQAGNALNTIGKQSAILAGSTESMSDFQIAATALAGLNFFRIPLVYLMAYLLGQKVPFTLSENSKWLYSAVVLALFITSIAVPATAPIIFFVTAGLGLAASVYFFRQVLNERYKLEQKSKSLEQTISREEDVMLAIQKQAVSLQERLKTATDESSMIGVNLEITLLEERYEAQKKIISSALNQQIHQQQIMKALDFKKIDKSISLFLASSTAVGVILTLFMPPIGFGILAATALFGATYTLGRVSAPLFQSLGQWIASKRELHAKAPSTTVLNENKYSLLHESTADVMAGLTKKKKGSATDTNTNTNTNTATVYTSKALLPQPEAKESSDDDTDTESEEDQLSLH